MTFDERRGRVASAPAWRTGTRSACRKRIAHAGRGSAPHRQYESPARRTAAFLALAAAPEAGAPEKFGVTGRLYSRDLPHRRGRFASHTEALGTSLDSGDTPTLAPRARNCTLRTIDDLSFLTTKMILFKELERRSGAGFLACIRQAVVGFIGPMNSSTAATSRGLDAHRMTSKDAKTHLLKIVLLLEISDVSRITDVCDLEPAG